MQIFMSLVAFCIQKNFPSYNLKANTFYPNCIKFLLVLPEFQTFLVLFCRKSKVEKVVTQLLFLIWRFLTTGSHVKFILKLSKNIYKLISQNFYHCFMESYLESPIPHQHPLDPSTTSPHHDLYFMDTYPIHFHNP